MATDQVRIRSLYEGLYRNVIVFGLLIAAAWLFAAFSYYLSRATGADWFARSGAVMGLAGAAVTFSSPTSTSGRSRRRSRKASYRCPEESSLASNRPDPMWSFRTSVI